MNIFDFLKYLFDKNMGVGFFITAGFCLTLVFLFAIIGDAIIAFTKIGANKHN